MECKNGLLPPDQFQGLSFSSENFNRFDKKNSSHDLFKFQRAKLFDPDQQTRTNSETFCFLQPFTRLLVLLQSIYNNIRVVLNQKLKGLGILSTLFHRKQHSKIINIIKWQLCFECNTYLVTS